MPVSVKAKPVTANLRPSHLHVLRAICPKYIDDPVIDWPLHTRATLREACGFSPTNSMNRLLHGVKDGPGKHPGLIDMGLVEVVKLVIEGTCEANYRITAKGIQCLNQ